MTGCQTPRLRAKPRLRESEKAGQNTSPSGGGQDSWGWVSHHPGDQGFFSVISRATLIKSVCGDEALLQGPLYAPQASKIEVASPAPRVEGDSDSSSRLTWW